MQGIEIGSHTTIYGWVRPDKRLLPYLTLFEGQLAETISWLELGRQFWRLLLAESYVCWFVPSYLPLSSTVALLACKLAGVPVIMMNESHRGSARSGSLGQHAKRLITPLFSGAILGGRPHAAYFKALGIHAWRIRLGYDVVDNDHFTRGAKRAQCSAAAVREKWRLPTRYFLSVGRFEDKKNLNALVRAYGAIAQHTLTSLVFVGSGRMRESLLAECAKAGLKSWSEGEGHGDAREMDGPKVRFYDFKQFHDLPEFYGLASAFILPSFREEWGLVVNEAMAAGVPVLVSRRAGCAADLVVDGVTGFSFDPGNVEELAERLLEIDRDPELATQLGSRAQSHIQKWNCELFGQGVDELASMVARERGMLASVI